MTHTKANPQDFGGEDGTPSSKNSMEPNSLRYGRGDEITKNNFMERNLPGSEDAVRAPSKIMTDTMLIRKAGWWSCVGTLVCCVASVVGALMFRSEFVLPFAYGCVMVLVLNCVTILTASWKLTGSAGALVPYVLKMILVGVMCVTARWHFHLFMKPVLGIFVLCFLISLVVQTFILMLGCVEDLEM